jgi:hypothetical protein
VVENNYGEEKLLNAEKFLNVWTNAGSYSTAEEDGSITALSQSPSLFRLRCGIGSLR